MNVRTPLLLSLAISAALIAANAPAVGAADGGTAAPASSDDALPPLAVFRNSDLDPSKNVCNNLADPDEKKTPLKMAKRLYRDMGFAPSKKRDELFDAMMMLAREASGKQFDEMKSRLEEIMALLEAAGGK